MKYFAPLFIFFALATNAYAAAPTPEGQANYATRLFSDICAKNMGKPVASTARWLKEMKLGRTETKEEADILSLKPGTVWEIKNDLGRYLVVLTEPHECSIWSQTLDVGALKKNFVDLVEGVAADDVKVDKVVDEEDKGKEGAYRQLGYLVKFQDAGSFLFLLGVNEEDKDFVATITINPASDAVKAPEKSKKSKKK